MQHIKITRAGRDSRLTEDFTYILERLNNGMLRISSIGGKFSTLVNPDTTDIEFEYTGAGEVVPSPLKGWRNSYAVNLWATVYADTLKSDYPEDATLLADEAVAEFKERWEGTTFLHNVEPVA